MKIVNHLRKKALYLSLLILILCSIYFFKNTAPVIAQNCDEITCSKDNQSEDEYLKCNRDKQACWENKIAQTQKEQITLKNTINLINGQIVLQTLQIEQTKSEVTKLQRELEELTQRIYGLSLSLDRLSAILVERIQSSYKQKRTNTLITLFTQDSFNDFVQQLKYLQQAQNQTALAMHQAENQRLQYHEQKTLKEQKQKELEAKEAQLKEQQAELTQQKGEQQYLLEETKDNEARYEKELAKTLAELEAIQSIIAGRGNETKVGSVEEGEKIATIISGASACSTGTHLHFEIAKSGAHINPASVLKSADITWDNAPDGAFGFSGNWAWPVNNEAIITQGYGMTYYARVKRFYGGAPHTGIDLVSKTSNDFTVKAVKAGTLYRGSIACGGGQLRYVKVEHKDSDYASYYLHINY